ncbi:hypothetical protein ACIBF5_16820 [Micromonospora sp. NPDC050417]|uniref:hypothetical protein n=1 Tax=Micromonospora sp. NPDC050417 TaxID=3364280 RepID=UPI0037B8A093
METSETPKAVQAKRLALAVVAAAALGGAIAAPAIAAEKPQDSSVQQVEAWNYHEPYYI